MRLPFGLVSTSCGLILLATLGVAGCSKKGSEPAVAARDLPPLAKAGDAPEFARSLSLLYPQAELYRVSATDKNSGSTGIILQKTNHPLEDVVRYYSETLRKHDFTESTHLVQANGALLQYERKTEKNADKRELVSIDISKLPYADNLLIRIGRSEADYSRGGEP
ncbi:MAG: hypothetical protein OHK0011_09070 [Turneriella sp.]